MDPFPGQVTLIIRRAEIKDRAAMSEAVWRLAQASTTSAHWKREAFSQYWAVGMMPGGLQVKALFIALLTEPAGDICSASREKLRPTAEEVVGFAAFSVIASAGEGECTLENMAVAGPRQRQGIGKRLLSAGTLWCRAHASQCMFLEVRETNQAAIALYQSDGFLVVGHRPAYYRDPEEAALQMRKVLAPAAGN